jgi:hypothetical protein
MSAEAEDFLLPQNAPIGSQYPEAPFSESDLSIRHAQAAVGLRRDRQSAGASRAIPPKTTQSLKYPRKWRNRRRLQDSTRFFAVLDGIAPLSLAAPGYHHSTSVAVSEVLVNDNYYLPVVLG